MLTKVKQGKLSKKFHLQNQTVAQLVSNFRLSSQSPTCSQNPHCFLQPTLRKQNLLIACSFMVTFSIILPAKSFLQALS
jgi:hypothetical protein